MESLEQKGAIRFLIYLVGKGDKVDITNALQDLDVGQSALYTAIEKLVKAGLISEVRSDSFPFPRRFSLTVKGENIARKLAEIENNF